MHASVIPTRMTVTVCLARKCSHDAQRHWEPTAYRYGPALPHRPQFTSSTAG